MRPVFSMQPMLRAPTLLFIVHIFVRLTSAADTTVTIRQGKLRGVKLYTESRTNVYGFLGIPYATPPTGSLRFAAPEYHKGWENEVLTASAFGPPCPQSGMTSPSTPAPSEDCLFVNVWTPETALKYKRTAPVVVLIEGEGFIRGYPGRFPGQDLAAEGIVVVSIAYRLNVFGFLCLEDIEARGNLGLLDQYLGLLWIRENIESFGGDPSKVTFMGHHAGAVSALLHMISPRPQGLFQRAILMSGSPLSPWSKGATKSQASRAIVRSLGCSEPTVRHTLRCLRSKSTDQILKAFETQYKDGRWSDLTLPVVDEFLPEKDQYLPLTADEALRTGQFLKMSILTGIATDDGVVSTPDWRDLQDQGEVRLRQFISSSLTPPVLNKYNISSSKPLESMINWFYFRNQYDMSSLLSGLVQMYSEAQFAAPHEKQLHYIANTSFSPPIFAYVFNHPGIGIYSSNGTGGGLYGGDLMLLTGPSSLEQIGRSRFLPLEERLSVIIKRSWVDFIRHGSVGTYGGYSWRQYRLPERYEVVLRATSSIREIDKLGIGIWNDLIPQIIRMGSTSTETTPILDIQPRNSDGVGYKSAMYTLLVMILILVCLLVVCVILLRKRWILSTEREF